MVINPLPYQEAIETKTKSPWFALQVRARREAQVAAQLEARGYEYFLPLYKSIRNWSDRVKEIEQPLFPGYLFSRFELQNRGGVLMAPGVQQIVSVGKTAAPVEESELEWIRQALASGLASQPWPYVQVGERVRVTYGSLTNLEGTLVNFKGRHRVVLSLTLLQRAVAVEVDLAWVKPLHRPTTEPVARLFQSRAAAVALVQ